MKVIDFPIVRQGKNYTCGCGVIQAYLCYYGIDEREDDVMKYADTTEKDGTSFKSLQKVFKKFGLKTKPLKLNVEQLVKLIDKTIPVIVCFQAWSEDKNPDYSGYKDGHWATVIGYDEKDEIVIFSDPSSYVRTYLTYEAFNQRWHDEDGDGKNMTIWE